MTINAITKRGARDSVAYAPMSTAENAAIAARWMAFREKLAEEVRRKAPTGGWSVPYGAERPWPGGAS